MVFSGLVTMFIAISVDTSFYTNGNVTWSHLFQHPVVTPLNNLRYNLATGNLALHGLHPWYQHALVNLPQLLGPAAIPLMLRPQLSTRLYSAISGVAVLSIFQHQEARFLLPTIPLILSSIRLPSKRLHLRLWVGLWVLFNAFFGVLMGTYHQGGIVQTQLFMSQVPDATEAVWWKTYSPPVWLLDGKNEVLRTHDVMGMKGELMIDRLLELATCGNLQSSVSTDNGTYLIAPLSATFLDAYTAANSSSDLRLEEVWRYRKHLNLDDMDFGDDGVWNTLQRVVTRRGLGVWRATKDCSSVVP